MTALFPVRLIKRKEKTRLCSLKNTEMFLLLSSLSADKIKLKVGSIVVYLFLL